MPIRTVSLVEAPENKCQQKINNLMFIKHKKVVNIPYSLYNQVIPLNTIFTCISLTID